MSLQHRESQPREPRRQESARPGSSKLLLFAGLLTWAMIAVPYVYWAFEEPGGFDTRWRIWLSGHLVFGLLLVLTFWFKPDHPSAREARRHRMLLVAQVGAALVAIGAVKGGLIMILLVVLAAQVPFSQGLRASILWSLAQTAVAAPLALHGLSPGRILVETGTQIGFQLFAVYASTTAVREREARAALTEANAELLSTRQLLADSSRLAERRRISRELHDLMGHHLTALVLQLEAAGHQAQGQQAERLVAARQVATELLSDVRQVVRVFRKENCVDLAGPLRTLAGAIPRLQIHLDLPPELAIDDPVRANAILRSVQEIVTNAARHSGAENLWVELRRIQGGIEIRARDDGRGARRLQLGAGLTGMRERLEELGGRLHLDNAPGQGFKVEVSLPLKETTA